MTSHEDARFISLMISRLERISVDSYWAHRASGVRGALFRVLSKLEDGQTIQRIDMDVLISASIYILDAFAKEKYLP